MPDHLQETVVRLAGAAVLAFMLAFLPCAAHGQSTREVSQQAQFWGSLNTTSRFTDRFGMVADYHVRWNLSPADPSFYFLRFGSHFWLTERFTLTAGYAHMWKAPTCDGCQTWTGENRIYEQFQYHSKIGSTSMVQRFRIEQRWQQQVQNDVLTGEWSYSNRLRYLLSFGIPVSKNARVPSLALSDEILIQFGPGITYNTFDQNRFFVGIKENLGRRWSFDFGYMPVYQQKASGYQYDLNHTIRLFFYYTPDFRKKKAEHEPASNEE